MSNLIKTYISKAQKVEVVMYDGSEESLNAIIQLGRYSISNIKTNMEYDRDFRKFTVEIHTGSNITLLKVGDYVMLGSSKELEVIEAHILNSDYTLLTEAEE